MVLIERPSFLKTKIISPLIILATALLFLLIFYLVQNKDFSKPSAQLSAQGYRFQVAWQKDVQSMMKKNMLPISWAHIKTIKINTDSPLFKTWLPNLKAPIYTTSKGDKELGLLTHLWDEDSRKIGIMIQYSIKDIKTNEVEWELARNLYIQKKTPAAKK